MRGTPARSAGSLPGAQASFLAFPVTSLSPHILGERAVVVLFLLKNLFICKSERDRDRVRDLPFTD